MRKIPAGSAKSSGKPDDPHMRTWPHVKPVGDSSSVAGGREALPNAAIGTSAPGTMAASSSVLPDSIRVSCALKGDGSFDLDAMQPRTRDRLMRAVRTTPALLGSSTTASVSEAESGILRETAKQLAGALELIAMSLARMAGYHADDAATLALTENERTALGTLGGRVLAKYRDKLEYADEAALCAAVLSIAGSKVSAMRDHHAARRGRGDGFSVAKGDATTAQSSVQ